MALQIKPIVRKAITLRIQGTSPLVMHQWSEKAKRMIREKHAGKKSKNRDIRDPEQECLDATYVTEDGKFAIPGMALKRAFISAAHKDIGIEKTLVRKALFVRIEDPDGLIPIEAKAPIMREDVMRVGMGSTDLRYRPEFKEWGAVMTIEFDAELLTENDVIALVNRAGFGVGILEGRPEVGRDFGRFEIDMKFKTKVEVL